MKTIMVMFDSLNRRMLPPYGCEWIHAPNFDRLAKRTVTFENHYAGSMPCMPARRELHTGRSNFLHRSWGPVEPFDESLPEILQDNNIYTHLVSDHQHYWEDGGATYHNRYSSWEIARGQEGDHWKGHIADPDYPNSKKKMRGNLWRQDIINRSYATKEEDMPQAQTFANGLHFIQTNHAEDNWFLQIETFDPHEPYFTQKQYKDLYPHNYDGPEFDWPDYARVEESEEEIAHVRYEYAALVSMCDHYLGKVIDEMDRLQMWEDTMLIVCTDHGYLLGEHDWWAKNIMPWYNETIHIPLFIWDPKNPLAGERRSALTQTVDLMPTILDFFDISIPGSTTGAALTDTVAHDASVHEGALFGTHGAHINVTDGRYVYMRAPVNPQNTPLNEYTLMPTHMNSLFSVGEMQNIELAEPFSFTKGCKTMKIPARTYINAHTFGTQLFDLENDPGQLKPLVDDEIERKMIALMIKLMRLNDAPTEQYERVGLPIDGIIQDEHLALVANFERVQKSLMKPPEGEEIPSGNGYYNLDTPLKKMLLDNGAKMILMKYIPHVVNSPVSKMAELSSLKQIAGFMRGMVPEQALRAIAKDLESLPAPINK